MTGAHTGPLEGIAPTGKEVTVTGIIVSRFEGGKVAEEWENLDELAIMEVDWRHPATQAASQRPRGACLWGC